MKVEATIHKAGIAGGVWQLKTSDGRTFQIVDPPSGLTVDGLKVDATLELARDVMGIGMTAPNVRVTKWSKR